MKSILWSLIALLSALLAIPAQADQAGADPFRGWNLLSSTWDRNHPLDFMSIEWEYFMVHDNEGRFNGIVGYVLTNPRGKGGPAGSLVIPKGGNIAIGGQVDGQKAIGDYINFGISHTQASGTTIDTDMFDPNTGHWARMEGLSLDQPTLRLQGKTDQFAWDLYVVEAAPEVMQRAYETHEAFTAVTDSKRAGKIPGEMWSVDALWPRTKVHGTITILASGEIIPIDGKGYRENSWGRYAMPLDGWDFLVFSEKAEDGVMAVLQTYHHSTKLDFMDVSFRDQGELKIMRFQGGTQDLKWRHLGWSFDRETFQCVPKDWEVSAENDEYRIVLKADIPAPGQEPFLSNKTLGTRAFFIQEQYPKVYGQIYRQSDGTLVTNFSGQAGGEFALHKSLLGLKSSETCEQWGKRFSNGF